MCVSAQDGHDHGAHETTTDGDMTDEMMASNDTEEIDHSQHTSSEHAAFIEAQEEEEEEDDMASTASSFHVPIAFTFMAATAAFGARN